MHRLAVIASHPIQYQAPWFRALAQRVDLAVFYCHRITARDQIEAGFSTGFEWDLPLLDGYHAQWLRNTSARPGVERFGGCDTPEIASILATGRFDACLVNGWYLKSYLQAARACRTHGIPILMRGDSQLGTSRSVVKRTLKYPVYRWGLTHIDAHLYVGRANHEYLTHYGVSENRLFFAPHFVENARFAAGASTARADGAAAAFRAAIGAGPQTFVWMFAGKLIEKKRPSDFVEAVIRLHEAGADVRGIIVGSGPMQETLNRRVSETNAPVTFLGFRNQTEIPTCYAASDGLVLPSDARETWGLVVNEAMACGLPAVVSDAVGCHRDLIDGRLTGRTYRLGHVDGLASAMADVDSQVRADPLQVRHAVDELIAGYTCEAAVGGTLRALDSLVRGELPAVRRRSKKPVFVQ